MITQTAEAGDARSLLVQMHQTIDTLFDAWRRAQPGNNELVQRKLFLALELRCKIEELVVLPVLGDATADRQATRRRYQRDIERLRALVDHAREHGISHALRQHLIATLEGVTALHFSGVECLLADAGHAPRIDSEELGREIQAWLKRWHDEIDATGDIEDEEMDPVGLPPR